jgi:hypothetical protein
MATRPPRFANQRYVGDKRTQVVYDLDDPKLDQVVVDELMASEQFVCFGPDTLPEARNRSYRLSKAQRHRALRSEGPLGPRQA